MNTKLLTSAGCLLLLAAAMAPAVLGHEERPVQGGNPAGVSGRYVGSAGPAIVAEPGYDDTLSAGAILCDLEVAGDGTAQFPQDEALVDGSPGGSAPNTVDDGGQGGACHTNSYLHGAYNTPGCPSDDAYAANNFPGGPFIGAACDWKTTSGGTPQSDILLLCIVNSVLTGQPLNIVECLLTFLACALNPTGDCTVDGTESCGSDGSADGINYGHGVGGVAYPTAVADQGDVALGLNPSGGCLSGDATAQVFVFDAVTTSGTPHVHPAGTGEIYEGGLGAGGTPVCAEEFNNGVYTTWPCPPELCGLPLGYVAIASSNGASVGTLSCHDTSHNVVGSISTTSFTAGPINSGNHAHCNVSAVNGATYAFAQCGKV